MRMWWVKEMVFREQHIQVLSLLVTPGAQEKPHETVSGWSGGETGLEESTEVMFEEWASCKLALRGKKSQQKAKDQTLGTHSTRCEGGQRVTECRQEERTQKLFRV